MTLGGCNHTRQAGHVHTVGALDLSNHTVGAAPSRQGRDEDNS